MATCMNKQRIAPRHGAPAMLHIFPDISIFCIYFFNGGFLEHMNQYLIPFLVSMVPLIELRGAIPIAQGMGLPIVPSYIVCIIGNMIPVPFIYLFARRVLVWGADKPVIGKFFTFCLEKGEKGGKKLTEKAGRGLFVALLLFVGIPLPGTGAWTGTLAASILDMDFKSTVVAVMLGVLLAGVIMMTASVIGFSLI